MSIIFALTDTYGLFSASDKKDSENKKQIRLIVAVLIPLTIIVASAVLACVWVKRFKNQGLFSFYSTAFIKTLYFLPLHFFFL